MVSTVKGEVEQNICIRPKVSKRKHSVLSDSGEVFHIKSEERKE